MTEHKLTHNPTPKVLLGKKVYATAHPASGKVVFVLVIQPRPNGDFSIYRDVTERNMITNWGPAVGHKFTSEEHALNWLKSHGWEVEEIT